MDNHISGDEIRSQLTRILASEGFARCPRMQRFLRFVVEESLAGRASELSEYVVGLAVFDRSAEFEPALDPIVRNDARRLRMKLLEYYQRSRTDRVSIEVPKGGYTPVFRRSFRSLAAVIEGIQGDIDELQSMIAADLNRRMAA